MKRSYAFIQFLLILIVICSIGLADTPQTVNYQGYLTDSSNNPLTGTYSIEFRIYDNIILGNLKWFETQSSVTVTNGIFSVVLGSVTPIPDTVFSGADRYLMILINGEAVLPRTKLTSTPYSQSVETIDGATGGEIDGALIIHPDNFSEDANGVDIRDSEDRTVAAIKVDANDDVFLDFYDPVDSKSRFTFGRHFARLGSGGLTFFGATTSDTTLRIYSEGNIQSVGKIVMGQNSSYSGIWATAFGYNNTATGDTSTISGGSTNSAENALATVSGGGNNTASGFASVVGGGRYNDATNYGATIGGGFENFNSGYIATISGGSENATSGNFSTISGGELSEVGSNHSVVGGGYNNTVYSNYGTVGGGYRNDVEATSEYSVIPGGFRNRVNGQFSFVAGSDSYSNYNGCFVWSDEDTTSVFQSTGDNQFLIKADGGVGINTNDPGLAHLKVVTGKTYAGHFETNNPSSSAQAVRGVYNGTGTYDGVGVYGESVPQDYYGIGGYFLGGYRGIYATCVPTGTGTYTAIRSQITAATGTATKYGIYSYISGTATTNYGIYSYASGGTTNYAGYFSGNVHVNGTLSKSAGSFKIDHPLDPENKYLSHSFVESPDMMNVYNGNVILDKRGKAVVELPDYFEALNREFRYQLTCIGGFAPVYIESEISNNQFVIAGGTAGMKISWQVTGVRQDAYANEHRIQVEEYKTGDEQGKYLHPKEYGISEDLGIDQSRHKKEEEEEKARKERVDY